jgi:uncharacterized membrane protein
MSDVRSIRAETDQTKHEATMRKYREQRAQAVNALFGIGIVLFAILAIVAAVCAAVLMIRATF